MQSFVVVASFVLELVGGGSNDSPVGTNVSENTISFSGLIFTRIDPNRILFLRIASKR